MNPSPEKVSVVQLLIAYPLLIPLIDRLNEAGAEDELKVISRQLTRLSFRAAARQLLVINLSAHHAFDDAAPI